MHRTFPWLHRPHCRGQRILSPTFPREDSRTCTRPDRELARPSPWLPVPTQFYPEDRDVLAQDCCTATSTRRETVAWLCQAASHVRYCAASLVAHRGLSNRVQRLPAP